MDGSFAVTSMMILTPTSRGSVTISSKDPKDNPIVDPKYLDSAVDRAVIVHGTKAIASAFLGTETGKELFEFEAAPPGMKPVTLDSTDVEMEARIRATGMPHFHSSGTAAMGKVVDIKLNVYGVKGLRVVDNSIMPVAIGAHPQATLYAVAERAADIILAATKV